MFNYSTVAKIAKKFGIANYNPVKGNKGELTAAKRLYARMPHLFDAPKDFKAYTPKTKEIKAGLVSAGIEEIRGVFLIPIARHGKHKWEKVRVTKNGIFKYSGKLSESILFRNIGQGPQEIFTAARNIEKTLKRNEVLSFRIGHRGSSWHEFISAADLDKYLREVILPRFKGDEEKLYANITVTKIRTKYDGE